VDVSLCGSIPRSEMPAHHSSLWPRLEGDADQPSLATDLKADRPNSLATTSLTRKVSDDDVVSNTQVIEPPSWAVPARGEAILEPISDTGLLHKPVDLTKRAVYRIGRSDVSDMQLLHCASSRRHAILFHHPNGSCYVVDCGSAHGTFVNGVRVRSSVTEHGVVPQKVKRGALLRFGGPGAPTFILKSFSVGFDSLLKNVMGSNNMTEQSNLISEEPQNTPDEEVSTCALDALVTLNTRLNSVGYMSCARPFKNGKSQLMISELQDPCSGSSKLSFLKRRHAISFDDDVIEEQPLNKRFRSGEVVIESTSSVDSDDSIPMVSPYRHKPVLSFNFNDEHRPVVSPNPFEESSRTVMIAMGAPASILNVSLSLPSTIKKKSKRVNFCADPPDVYYAMSVTPDSESLVEGY